MQSKYPLVAAALTTAILGIAVASGPILAYADRDQPAREQRSEIRWRKSFAVAEAEAKRDRKPLLVEFSADWCGPCRKMEETTLRDAGVVALTEKLVSVRVDVDADPKVADRFRVQSIPQAFVLSPSGEIRAQSIGFADAERFKEFLVKGLERSVR